MGQTAIIVHEIYGRTKGITPGHIRMNRCVKNANRPGRRRSPLPTSSEIADKPAADLAMPADFDGLEALAANVARATVAELKRMVDRILSINKDDPVNQWSSGSTFRLLLRCACAAPDAYTRTSTIGHFQPSGRKCPIV